MEPPPMNKTEVKTKAKNYSATIAGRNVTESQAEALAHFAARQAAESFLRHVFATQLRSPLKRINTRIAMIERIMHERGRR